MDTHPRLVQPILSLVVGYLVIGLAGPAVADEATEKALGDVFQKAWEFDVREDPIFATRVGDHRFNDRLAAEKPGDFERRREFKQQVLKSWKSLDPEKLSPANRMNYAIFGQLLENELAEYSHRTYLMPITNRWGFHVWVPELPKRVPLRSLEDYRNYIARLRDVSRYADDQMALMKLGVQEGRVLPAVVLDGYAETIEPHIVADPEKSLLYAPFQKLPPAIDSARHDELRRLGRSAIAESVVPAYRRFLKFMQTTYLPAARGSIAAATLPNGREFYRHRVRQFTTLDVTPDEVHQLGLSEVKRIREEMQATVREAKFDGDLKAFVRFLRTDPRFYAKTPKQLQMEVALILKKMDGRLPRLFRTLPRTPYGLREIPAYIAPKTTSAYYTQPSGDGTQPGYYYLNTYNLKSRPLYEMEALSLHEAVPGHHLQLALQQELADLPNFRRYSSFTAYIEGWALYAERLGLEVGFYDSPYTDFGRLSFEMWRACRLVVDTGMHYKGWSRQRAIDFMAEHTALSEHNIRAEIDRYISWPGQALAYKMGELKIRQLRKQAEDELGLQFDVRRFHDAVLLSGAVPLTILEANVNRYIADARSR